MATASTDNSVRSFILKESVFKALGVVRRETAAVSSQGWSA